MTAPISHTMGLKLRQISEAGDNGYRDYAGRTLSALERRELVTWEPDPRSRWAYIWRLTDAGQEALK